ncbi:hypothetical protein RD110_26475 [Rhodoferax koreense]|uniref:Secreted protein n=1 Tax=Rhodoferax koreensis TaxID=1842727 RepID=A0A1P8K4Q0_9BURK|nr:hypothetical protein [Rhodoferax koreense]APW40990.1 hypothetical protein RD110_26475 [Rhodoferax koreense]
MSKTSESNTTGLRQGIMYWGLAATLACAAAYAQPTAGTTGIDASGSTTAERAACMNGRTQQDEATCLREANNAAADKKKGELTTQGPVAVNALTRCEPLAGEDRAACEARILGYGSTSGSVAGGGVIREVETVVLPKDKANVIVEPKTAAPVILVPQ